MYLHGQLIPFKSIIYANKAVIYEYDWEKGGIWGFQKLLNYSELLILLA